MSRHVLVSLCALLTACGPLVYAELEAEDVCNEILRQDVPAAPEPVSGTFKKHEELKVPKELRSAGLAEDGKVELTRVEVAVEGVDSLYFVQDIRVRAQLDPSGPLQDLGPGIATEPTRRVFALDEPADITPLMKRGTVLFEAAITASLPQKPWTVAMIACYRATGSYEWSP